MANPFKQKQDEAKKEKLISDCKAMMNGTTIGRHRAVQTYAKQAGVSKEQAERVLGLR